ncbi:hypothetical protein NQ314_016721, partial [Rhamnusium bicolor]
MFNINAFIISIIFFKLAMKWPRFIAVWCKNDYVLRCYEYYENIRRHFHVVLIFATVAATVEHILAMLNTYSKIDCNNNSSNKTCLELYFTREYPFVFDYIPFSIPLGICLM